MVLTQFLTGETKESMTNLGQHNLEVISGPEHQITILGLFHLLSNQWDSSHSCTCFSSSNSCCLLTCTSFSSCCTLNFRAMLDISAATAASFSSSNSFCSWWYCCIAACRLHNTRKIFWLPTTSIFKINYDSYRGLTFIYRKIISRCQPC